MALEDEVQKLRESVIAQGKDPVPGSLQGVTKARIEAALREIDKCTTDQVDAVFALLDDENASFYHLQYKRFPEGLKFCDGATTAQVSCHFGILQRGDRKSDPVKGSEPFTSS